MFKPFSVRSHGLLVRVVSLSVIFCLMYSGKNLLCILPFGMWCVSACRIILVRMLLAMCGFVGVVVSEKAAYVS